MKIGVYVCECGINIGATVDVEKVAEYAATLLEVAASRSYRYMCSDPGQELIKKDIKDLELDRIIVASCSPRMHEPTFRTVLEEMGLNPLGVKFLGPLPPEELQMFDRVIYPMVGWIARQRHFLLNWEVERIVYVPIQNLLNPHNYACYRLSMAPHSENTQGGQTQDFPCFRHETENQREVLWGATYRIVMAFLELVYGFKPPSLHRLPIIHGYLDNRYFNRGR